MALLAVFVALIWFLFPETKGRTLEEIAGVFDGPTPLAADERDAASAAAAAAAAAAASGQGLMEKSDGNGIANGSSDLVKADEELK